MTVIGFRKLAIAMSCTWQTKITEKVAAEHFPSNALRSKIFKKANGCLLELEDMSLSLFSTCRLCSREQIRSRNSFYLFAANFFANQFLPSTLLNSWKIGLRQEVDLFIEFC